MSKIIICIACPMGCGIEISDDFEVLGNKCEKGKDYAIQEAKNPTRIVTTSLKVSRGDFAMVSAKSTVGIPKAKVREAVSLLKKMVVQAPISSGQVILGNILDTGADIVATREVSIGSMGK